MAQFFKPNKHSKTVTKVLTATVAALDHQARAVVRGQTRQQQTRFISGALPDEVIQFKTDGKHGGLLQRVMSASPERRPPPCQYYQQCGGCDFQHADEAYQQHHKQTVVTQLFNKFGVSADPLPWQPALLSEPNRYRRRVRLATRWLGKEQRLIVGFRAAQSHQIVPIADCLVADQVLLQVVNTLYPLLNVAAVASQLGHIEVIDVNKPLVLLRLTDRLEDTVIAQLRDWQTTHEVDVWLQSDTETWSLNPAATAFDTSIDGDTLYFQPGDFLQVNGSVNQRMVEQAMNWLQPTKTQRVIDFFAGIGNFSLPLARRCKAVVTVEGVARMAQQTHANAQLNGLDNVTALTADLNQITVADLGEAADLWCLDPARPGAEGVVRLLQKLAPQQRPQKILYVSCAADTLARDVAVIEQAGYRLTRIGTVDMFPQTHHIETMVCLERVA